MVQWHMCAAEQVAVCAQHLHLCRQVQHAVITVAVGGGVVLVVSLWGLLQCPRGTTPVASEAQRAL